MLGLGRTQFEFANHQLHSLLFILFISWYHQALMVMDQQTFVLGAVQTQDKKWSLPQRLHYTYELKQQICIDKWGMPGNNETMLVGMLGSDSGMVLANITVRLYRF